MAPFSLHNILPRQETVYVRNTSAWDIVRIVLPIVGTVAVLIFCAFYFHRQSKRNREMRQAELVAFAAAQQNAQQNGWQQNGWPQGAWQQDPWQQAPPVHGNYGVPPGGIVIVNAPGDMVQPQYQQTQYQQPRAQTQMQTQTETPEDVHLVTMVRKNEQGQQVRQYSFPRFVGQDAARNGTQGAPVAGAESQSVQPTTAQVAQSNTAAGAVPATSR